jgi:hypothetical protein
MRGQHKRVKKSGSSFPPWLLLRNKMGSARQNKLLKLTCLVKQYIMVGVWHHPADGIFENMWWCWKYEGRYIFMAHFSGHYTIVVLLVTWLDITATFDLQNILLLMVFISCKSDKKKILNKFSFRKVFLYEYIWHFCKFKIYFWHDHVYLIWQSI